MPMDVVTGTPPDEELPTDVTPYAADLQDRLREAHHQVRGNLKIPGETMTDRSNARASFPAFQEGQRV